MRKAIKKHEIIPWIQPIYDAKNEMIAGGEILLRWFEPSKEFVSPEAFISLAEESGLIRDLTQLCFQDAAKGLAGMENSSEEPL